MKSINLSGQSLKYIDYNAWCDAQIQIALEQVKRGEVFSFEEVVDDLRKRGYDVYKNIK